MLPTGGHQRLAESQAVRDGHVVISEPVDEHERTFEFGASAMMPCARIRPGRAQDTVRCSACRKASVSRRAPARRQRRTHQAPQHGEARRRNPPYDQPIIATRSRTGSGMVTAVSESACSARNSLRIPGSACGVA